MQREVPFSVMGVGLVPDDFYKVAERVIQQLPEEWDSVVIMPQFTWGKAGMPNAYIGAGCAFHRGSKYVAFMVEHPRQLRDDALRAPYVDRVRRAFAKLETKTA